MSDLEILQKVYGDLKYWTVEELDLQFRLIALSRKESKKEWVGLTDDEIDKWNIVGHESLREFVRAIEAKLKDKNS